MNGLLEIVDISEIESGDKVVVPQEDNNVCLRTVYEVDGNSIIFEESYPLDTDIDKPDEIVILSQDRQ